MASLPRFSLPPALTRALPGTSRSFGPPRRVASTREYASRTGMPLTEVAPAEMLAPPEVRLFGGVEPGFVPTQSETIGPLAVFRLENAAVYGPDAHLVAPDDTFLWDAAWHTVRTPMAALRRSKLYLRRRARRRRRLAGRTALLASDWAIGGFGHFLTDALPRWRLLQAAGHAAAAFDHFVLYHPGTPSANRLIEAARLPAGRLVPYDESCDLECEDLTGTTFPGAAPLLPPASAAWIRGLAPAGRPTDRLYLTRAGYRRHPGNAGELEAELARRGFTTIHGERDADVPAACARAGVIVGVEGSNLFNICFAPRGARIVVLLPGSGVVPYLPWLCQAAGLELAAVAARPDSPASEPVFPLSDVRAALDWALEGLPPSGSSGEHAPP